MSAKQIETISRAVADPRRFAILKQIAANNCAACSDLLAAFDITPPTMSHHLKELETAGLIEMTKQGKFVNIAFQREWWNSYLAALKNL